MKIAIVIFFLLIVSLTLVYAGGGKDQTVKETGAAVESEEPLTSDKLAEIIALEDPDTYLVDVRTEAEYNAGAIPSAINIPFDVIASNLPTEDRSARIIVYCRSGNRSGIAAGTLEELGFSNVLDFGGIGNWRGELEVRE